MWAMTSSAKSSMPVMKTFHGSSPPTSPESQRLAKSSGSDSAGSAAILHEELRTVPKHWCDICALYASAIEDWICWSWWPRSIVGVVVLLPLLPGPRLERFQISMNAPKLLPRWKESTPGCFCQLLSAVKNKPGHLDLFSGCRVAAKELADTTGRWVLTYDLLHDPSEDLLDSKQQRHIESMLEADCFLTMSAGPVCASFSRAVRPAVRSADAPRGLPNLTPSMATKVALGNAMSQWVASLVLRAEKKDMPFWVENLSGSYMWKQPEWIPIVARVPGFLTGYCRWGTVWRKRTRFTGSFGANGKRLLCQCTKPHVRLVGYNKEYKTSWSWTKLAEGYPQRLAAYLAKEMAESLKPIARRRTLDPAACARAGHRRIGEAGNPGPRPARARPEVDLDDVALVQASTLAIKFRLGLNECFWIGCRPNWPPRLGIRFATALSCS